MAEIHFSCPHCRAKLHVNEQFAGRLMKCPKCAQTSTVAASLPDRAENDSVVLAKDITPGRPSEAFAVQLARAFVYPFKNYGIVVLVVTTGVLVLLWLLAQFMCFFFITILVFLFYLCAYYISIIASSAAGEEELPDWPDLTDVWDAIIKPVLLVIGNGIVSITPLLVWMRFYGQWYFTTDIVTTATMGFFLILLALVYIPMGLLAVALFNSMAALNPIVILAAIAKIPLRYLLAWLLFFFVFFVNIQVKAHLVEIPIIGIVAQMFFSLYMMIVAMRILGLIYHANAQKLGWFE